MELPFSITYDGRESTSHRIDMRRYGQALVGLDRIVSGGLIVMFERRLPRPRERVELSIAVSEPEKGCVAAAGVVMAAYQGLQPYLPFLYEQIKEHVFDVVWTMLGYVFKVLGGREKAADANLEALIKVMNDMDERHVDDRRDERAALYADRQQEREMLLAFAKSMKEAAKDVVVRWSRLFGQFGGEVKLIPGFDHAASWSASVAGACPGNGRFSFAP